MRPHGRTMSDEQTLLPYHRRSRVTSQALKRWKWIWQQTVVPDPLPWFQRLRRHTASPVIWYSTSSNFANSNFAKRQFCDQEPKIAIFKNFPILLISPGIASGDGRESAYIIQ